jgi:NADH-dependent peroxiredoxin subunit F
MTRRQEKGATTMYDLIIIGGGPAGLTAAVYAVRKRLNMLLISPDLGGKTNARTAIEGQDTYQVINGAETVRRFRNEIEYLDFARMLEKVDRLERAGQDFLITTEGGRQLATRTVLLATGANAVRLIVPGADRYFQKGVMYSTVSYAPLFVDKQVAVIGSDDMALRGAAELAQIARQTYLVAPDAGQLSSALGQRVTSSRRVTLFQGWTPVAVEGDTFARHLAIRSASGEERSLPVDGIFVELGLRPQSELVQGLAELDDLGRVVVSFGAQTSVPGLFAAGDVTNLPAEQVLIAVGEGAKAALGAFDYLLRLQEAAEPTV